MQSDDHIFNVNNTQNQKQNKLLITNDKLTINNILLISYTNIILH